jgi:hypothetical protein
LKFKEALDKYLTTPPNENWCYGEDVINEFSYEFYIENEYWIEDLESECDKWMQTLEERERTPKESARIIERAFRRYLK